MGRNVKRSHRLSRKRLAQQGGQQKESAVVRAAMDRVGLLDAFEQLPRWLQDLVITTPRPYGVAPPKDLAHLPRIQTAAESLRYMLNLPISGFPVGSGRLSFLELHRFHPMARMAAKLAAAGRIDAGVAARFKPICDAFRPENREKMKGKLAGSCVYAMFPVNRPGRAWIIPCLFPREAAGRPTLRFEFRILEGEQRQCTLNAASRGMHRLGVAMMGGLHWIEVPAGQLGNPKPLPVFVQDHAVRRIVERLEDGTNRGFAMCVLSEATRDLRVIKTSGSKLWIEARQPDGMRVGYFIGSVVDGALLIRTFLFITMEGTPEARLLYRHLKLSRYQISRLRLDELATYANGGLHEDPAICHALRSSGCGHLLDLREARVDSSHVPITAGHIRQILPTLTGGGRFLEAIRSSPPAQAAMCA